MTLLDAYALIAFLIGGPAAARVRELLKGGDAAIASANLAETLDVCERLHGLRVERAMATIEPLLEGALAEIPLDLAIAARAAEIRARHYHRSSCPISLADAILLASAKLGDRVASADPHVLAIASLREMTPIELPEQGSLALRPVDLR